MCVLADGEVQWWSRAKVVELLRLPPPPEVRLRASCEVRGHDGRMRAIGHLHPIKLLLKAKTRFTFTMPSSGHALRWRANVTWRGTFRLLEHDAAAMHINRTPHARSLTSSHCRAFHSGSTGSTPPSMHHSSRGTGLPISWTWSASLISRGHGVLEQ